MTTAKSPALLYFILLCLSANHALSADLDDGACRILAQEEGVGYIVTPAVGCEIFYIPYLWCIKNCSGWTHFDSSFIGLLVVQFILPTVIFALVVPRRWHIDFPPHTFQNIGNGSAISMVAKLIFSAVAIGPIAVVDIVFWTVMILIMAGTMVLGGLQEMLLDFKTTRILRESHGVGARHLQLSKDERLELLVALLCGNFAGSGNLVPIQIQDVLTPSPRTPATLTRTKGQLVSIITSQATFGYAMGAATIFFLGGFIYNAIGLNVATVHELDVTPFAIWLMVMVYVGLVAATPLTGNNPNTVSILVSRPCWPRHSKWWNLLTDYYEDELHPCSMWDRGTSKRDWLHETQACKNHQILSERLHIGVAGWAGLYLAAGFLTLFPAIVAYEMAYNIPYPREGCRTFSYLLYSLSQIWLVSVAMKRSTSGLSYNDFPIRDASQNFAQPWQIVPRIFFYCTFCMLTVMAVLISFAASFFGTIFQIFGLYNNCFCQTSVWTWGKHADQRQTTLAHDLSADYAARLASFAAGATWAAVGVTAALCYVAWWYQKAIRQAVITEIDSL